MPQRSGGRCAAHGGGRSKGVPVDAPPAARGYDRQWQTVRDAYLADHPWCEWPGCSKPAEEVHHLDGEGPLGDNSEANLESRCRPHHWQETRREHWGPR